jgi:transcriptional regulator with XRE-family HTH domain
MGGPCLYGGIAPRNWFQRKVLKMARQPGPSVRSRRLVMMLTKLRIEHGLKQADLAKAVGMSPSKITRIESVESGIYHDDLLRLLDFYQIDGSRRAELLDLARHAEERGWLRIAQDANLPEDWQAWVDLEAEASMIFSYQPLAIPGLLQTAEYARAIIQATSANTSDIEVDNLVTARIARQARLGHARPATLHTIVEENVLTRPLGDADAWARQLRHLADSATHPNITLQVLPTQTGLHPALNGSFVILQYDDNTRLVLEEGKISSLFLDEDEQIEVYAQTWTEICALAYNVEKSIDFISVIAAQLDRKH